MSSKAITNYNLKNDMICFFNDISCMNFKVSAKPYDNVLQHDLESDPMSILCFSGRKNICLHKFTYSISELEIDH